MTFLVDALQHSGGREVLISWPRPNHGVGKYVGTVCQDLGQLSHRQLFAIIFLSQVKIELLFVAFWSVVESCNIDYIEQRKYVLCNSLLMVPFRSILQRIVEIRSSLDTEKHVTLFQLLGERYDIVVEETKFALVSECQRVHVHPACTKRNEHLLEQPFVPLAVNVPPVLHGVRHIRSLNDMFDDDRRPEVTKLLSLLRFNFG
jgi:hypothetical protein